VAEVTVRSGVIRNVEEGVENNANLGVLRVRGDDNNSPVPIETAIFFLSLTPSEL